MKANELPKGSVTFLQPPPFTLNFEATSIIPDPPIIDYTASDIASEPEI